MRLIAIALSVGVAAVCGVFAGNYMLDHSTHEHQYKQDADMHEYQVEITCDSTYIYQGGRLVDVLPFDSTQSFDQVMLADNL